MKFVAAALSLLAIGASAFSPKHSYVQSKSGLMIPSSSSVVASDDGNSPLWRPPMQKMVAGGAERAQEYYEGKSFCLVGFGLFFRWFSLVVRSFVRWSL